MPAFAMDEPTTLRPEAEGCRGRISRTRKRRATTVGPRFAALTRRRHTPRRGAPAIADSKPFRAEERPMKRLTCVSLSALALAFAITSSTGVGLAGANQISAGSIEFSPSVSCSHSNMKREGYGNVDTSTRLDITPTIGYCISNHYEVSGGVMTRHQSTNGNSETALGATAGIQYNFSPHGTVIPFLGLGFGTLFYDGFSLDNTAVLAPMLSGGIRVLVGSSASVNMSLGFQHEDNAEGEPGVSANRLIAGVGVSLFPWPKH